MFHPYSERKHNKVLQLNFVHFPNFEIRASLQLVLPSNMCCTSQFQNLIKAGVLVRGNAKKKGISNIS